MFHQLFQLIGRFTCGVKSTHQSSHAGPGDIIDRNVMSFKPFQHPDVSEPERTASFERQADARAWSLYGLQVSGCALLRAASRRTDDFKHYVERGGK